MYRAEKTEDNQMVVTDIRTGLHAACVMDKDGQFSIWIGKGNVFDDKPVLTTPSAAVAEQTLWRTFDLIRQEAA